MAKFLSLFLIFGLIFAAASAAKLPNVNGTCGPTGKVFISETVLGDGRVDDYQFIFASENNQIVFVRTDDGEVYRSGDEGISWELQTTNDKMPHVDDNPAAIRQIFTTESKDKTLTLYLLGGISNNGKMWVSKNGGSSYVFRDSLPLGITYLYIHPLFPGRIIGRRTMGPHELWLSNDFGESWSLLLQNVPGHSPVSWTLFPETNPDRIYATVYTSPNSTNPFSTQIVYSDDFFKTRKILQIDQSPLDATHHVLYWWVLPPNRMAVVSCVDRSLCTTRRLHISTNGGEGFHPAFFPDQGKVTDIQSDFWLHEIEDNSIWVHVPRQCSSEALCYGDLYKANAAERQFTHALSYSSPPDFTKFYSVEGIYIGNQFVTAEGTRPRFGDDIHTLITFNKGSHWKTLKPPPVDAKGQPYDCPKDQPCTLHLQGYEWAHMFTFFYSVPNAPGIMLANGNVGPKREERFDRLNLYYSRDGGDDWKEIRQGPHIVEIGDHGAAIVAVREDREDNSIWYTVDDGAEWHSCKYTQKLTMARNIRVSTGWDSRRFILYGRRKNSENKDETVIVHINLDNEYTGACTDANSDYESWTPMDESGQCVMGQHTVIKRRKPGKRCYLAEEHIHQSVAESCPCTEVDFECDFCFSRPTLNAPCTMECLLPFVEPEPEDICKDSSPSNQKYYDTVHGYRRIEGDNCNPVLPGSIIPKGRIPCGLRKSSPSNPPSSGSNVGTIIGVIIGLVVLLAIVFALLYLWRYNDSFYNAISYFTGIDNCFGRGTAADAASTIYAEVLGGSGSLLEEEKKDNLDFSQVKLSLDSDEDD